MTRTRLVETPQEFETVVDQYARDGYDVQRKGDRNVALCHANDWGSPWMHLLIAIFTVFLGNVPYALYRNFTADKVEVKVR